MKNVCLFFLIFSIEPLEAFAQSPIQIVNGLNQINQAGTQTGLPSLACNKPQDKVDGSNFHFRRCIAAVAPKEQKDPNKKLVYPTGKMVSLTVDPKQTSFQLKTKTSFSEQGALGNMDNAFTMNGPMFNPDGSAVGLIIRNGVRENPLASSDTGSGNFFHIDNSTFDHNGVIVVYKNGSTKFLTRSDAIKYLDPSKDKDIAMAFQGGPILLQNGKINDGFSSKSPNVKQRSAACITRNGQVRFMLTNSVGTDSFSDGGMNFWDFAQAGLDSPCIEQDPCVNTIFIDGSSGVVDSNFPPGGLNSNSPAVKNAFIISEQK